MTRKQAEITGIEITTNNYFVPCDRSWAEQAKQRLIEQMGLLVMPNYFY
jgi:hypothetical protein